MTRQHHDGKSGLGAYVRENDHVMASKATVGFENICGSDDMIEPSLVLRIFVAAVAWACQWASPCSMKFQPRKH
jgi:hypothetical protein